MLNSSQLGDMSKITIDKIDKSTLVDITAVKIDDTLPEEERMKNYLLQIKNPYCFMCGKTPVRICFKEDGKELGDSLKQYFFSLKNK